MKATYVDHMGSDLTTVNAARVSFNKKSDWVYDTTWGSQDKGLSGKDKKLIRYLAEHQHLSPFGHCFASFHVKAPVFVARQLVKHKFLRWNEVSRRYVDEPPEFYFPENWRGRPKGGIKQGSGEAVELGYDIEPYLMDGMRAYEKLLEDGVAPEMARMVLPLNCYTEWYWSGSLDAFSAMYNLRSKDDTQLETRLIAQQIGNILKDLYPVSWEALTDA